MSEEKNAESLSFDASAFYCEEHTWVRLEGDEAVIGITDFAQDQLGEVVFVELPEVDSDFGRGDEFGVLESAKSTSELYMPMAGRVIAINEVLEETPNLINTSPYHGRLADKNHARVDRRHQSTHEQKGLLRFR